MSELAKIAAKLLKKEGMNSTSLPQVNLYYSENTTQRAPLLYKQGIIFILQGEKTIYSGSETYTYNPTNFITLTVPLPLECQAISNDGQPIIGLTMDIEMPVLNRLIHQMEESETISRVDRGEKDRGFFIGQLKSEIKNSLKRLLLCLQDPIQSKILGNDRVKELLFHVLRHEQSSALYALAMKNTGISKIDTALRDIQLNYQKTFDVEGLAGSVNMSPSSFHQTFKRVTASSPIQYVKKVRLVKAKEILSSECQTVSEVASSVGYESVSQFNREFKRYFGLTPGSLKRVTI